MCVVCGRNEKKEPKRSNVAEQIAELSEQLDIIVVGITSIYSVKLEDRVQTIDHAMLAHNLAAVAQQLNIHVLSLVTVR